LAIAAYLIGLNLSPPPPPRTVRIATGAAGGAYAGYGDRIAARLRARGIGVEVVRTKGSIENYRRLMSDDAATRVDLALVQGGTRREIEGAQLDKIDLENFRIKAIGLLYSEPRSIAIGPNGSGTQSVARLVLELNGIDGNNAKLEALPTQQAIALLEAGELDAVMLVSSPQSENVRQLLRLAQSPAADSSAADDRIRLLDFERHVAYSRQIPYLSHVELAKGVIDLKENLPERGVSLLAPKAVLAARTNLHPRVAELAYKAATDIFSTGNAIDPPGEYPSIKSADLAVHPAIVELVRNGEGWMTRNLPFWAVRLISQLKLLLFPLLGVLLPAFKLAPMLWRFRLRVLLKHHYVALNQAERQLTAADSADEFAEGLLRLKNMRTELSRLSAKFPASFQNDFYHWRMHLRLVRLEAEAAFEAFRESEADAPATSSDAGEVLP
jgi:hypothetical protein